MRLLCTVALYQENIRMQDNPIVPKSIHNNQPCKELGEIAKRLLLNGITHFHLFVKLSIEYENNTKLNTYQVNNDINLYHIIS